MVEGRKAALGMAFRPRRVAVVVVALPPPRCATSFSGIGSAALHDNDAAPCSHSPIDPAIELSEGLHLSAQPCRFASALNSTKLSCSIRLRLEGLVAHRNSEWKSRKKEMWAALGRRSLGYGLVAAAETHVKGRSICLSPHQG